MRQRLYLFGALGRFSYRYRWPILIVWGLLLVASAFFAPNLSDRLKGGGFSGAGSDAEKVQDVLLDEFGASPVLVAFAAVQTATMAVVAAVSLRARAATDAVEAATAPGPPAGWTSPSAP